LSYLHTEGRYKSPETGRPLILSAYRDSCRTQLPGSHHSLVRAPHNQRIRYRRFQTFHFSAIPYNGMAFILGSFLIGLSTAYLMSRHWGGQWRFLVHTYSLLLCTIPLVTISGALLLIPATGSLVILLTSLVAALFVYRMVLHVCIIRGVHGLSALKATLVVLIFPLLFVGLGVGLGVLAFIVLLFMLTEGTIFEVLGAFDWFPFKEMFFHLRKGEDRKETPPRTK